MTQEVPIHIESPVFSGSVVAHLIAQLTSRVRMIRLMSALLPLCPSKHHQRPSYVTIEMAVGNGERLAATLS
jgi:hypothetical protein